MKNIKITEFNKIPQFTECGSWECEYSIIGLKDFIEQEIEQGLQLNPDFQRGHVWTEEQQIAYVEYFLRGGKSGRTVYFNNPSWNSVKEIKEYNDYVCVDGLQRITSLLRFINNEIKVFGSYYNEFTDVLRRTTFTIRINVNDLKTKQEVLRWYIDMNNGGTPHSKEEIERVENMIKELDE